jgi:hypothetical protein
MRARDMHKIAHSGTHQCAPEAWRRTPVVSGDYDFDATIQHRSNKDMAGRLDQHIARRPYGPVTAYNGYRNYTGDS